MAEFLKKEKRRKEYTSYMNGWRAGASLQPILPHAEDTQLRACYDDGYSHGRLAYQQSSEWAQESFGHKEAIIKAMESK